MKILCVDEAFDKNGNKLMQFTRGCNYIAEKSFDPLGYTVIDDDGNEETFFNLDILFDLPTSN